MEQDREMQERQQGDSGEMPERLLTEEQDPQDRQTEGHIPENSQTEEQDLQSRQTEGQIPENSQTEEQDPQSRQTEGQIPESAREEAQGPACVQTEGKHKTSGKTFRLSSFLLGVLATVAAAALFLCFYMVWPSLGSASSPLSLSAFKKLSVITSLIHDNYLNDEDEQAMTDGMYSGLMDSIGDEYATYYTKEEMEEVQMSQQGKMKGIGITFSMDEETGYVSVMSVSGGSTAEEAGIQTGDLITAINGTDTSGLSSSEVKSLIQDSDEDSVVLDVLRDGETKEYTVEKAYIDNTQIVVGGMINGTKIGYIDITSFTGLTAEQFSTIYDELNDEGMEGLIIDLRNDLGGLVSACEDTLDLFMPECVLVYEQNKDGEERSRTCDGENAIDIPVVLLVNENTASASEIFAGAVQDNDVGTVVGTQTYGKGVEQETWTLSDGSAVKMTTTHYFTPDHRDIDGVGITPDVTVEYDEDADEDPQFAKAEEVLQDMIDSEED